jgi:predicted permease
MRFEHWFYTVPLRLRSLFRRRQVETDLDEELQYHLGMKIQEYQAKGISPTEARRMAMLDMGGIELRKEECRDMRSVGLVEDLLQDLSYGFRILRKNPGFTAAAVITLVLGIGANTCMFSVADAAIFRSLPYPDPDQLVSIHWTVPTSVPGARSPLPGLRRDDWSDWRAQKTIFSDVALDAASEEMRLGSSAQGEPIAVGRISANMLDVLGVRPKIGRGFRPEDGNERVALISAALWVEAYGGDPAVVGKPITLDDGSYTITGIISREDQYCLGTNQAWLPLDSHLEDKKYYSSIARLRLGLTFDQAQREVRSASTWIGERRGLRGWIAELQPIRSWINNDSRTALLTLLGAVAFVLLIACANLANLFLSRAAVRQHEFAIRAIMGATPMRLFRQIILESLIVSAGGAFGAVILALWVIYWIPRMLPAELHLFAVHELSLTWRVLAFTFFAMVTTTLLSGVAPAFRTARGSAQEGITATSRLAGVTPATRRLHAIFQSLQIGLALVLLSGAGLMLRSFYRMVSTENGFDAKNLYLVSLDLRPKYYPTVQRQQAFVQEVLDRVKSMAGVRSAAISSAVPPLNAGFGPFIPEGTDNVGPPYAAISAVGPEFLPTLGIPLIAGRNFDAQDGMTSPWVAIIDRQAAEQYWPGQNAIGKRFRPSPTWHLFTVVGVVEHVKTKSFANPDVRFQVYLPLSQYPVVGNHLIIRTVGDPTPILASVRARIMSMGCNVNIEISTFNELYSTALGGTRLYLIVILIFAAIALVTAAVGIYGVLSYSVSQRMSEFGLRIALGADGSDLSRLLIGTLLMPVLAGLSCGIVGSFWLTTLLRGQLYQIEPHDPWTLICVLLLLLLVAAAASYMPLRHVTRTDPMIVLRAE